MVAFAQDFLTNIIDVQWGKRIAVLWLKYKRVRFNQVVNFQADVKVEAEGELGTDDERKAITKGFLPPSDPDVDIVDPPDWSKPIEDEKHIFMYESYENESSSETPIFSTVIDRAIFVLLRLDTFEKIIDVPNMFDFGEALSPLTVDFTGNSGDGVIDAYPGWEAAQSSLARLSYNAQNLGDFIPLDPGVTMTMQSIVTSHEVQTDTQTKNTGEGSILVFFNLGKARKEPEPGSEEEVDEDEEIQIIVRTPGGREQAFDDDPEDPDLQNFGGTVEPGSFVRLLTYSGRKDFEIKEKNEPDNIDDADPDGDGKDNWKLKDDKEVSIEALVSGSSSEIFSQQTTTFTIRLKDLKIIKTEVEKKFGGQVG